MEQFVEEFAKKNKDVFDLEAEEHKLEYTAVYKDFQDQFEKKIEVSRGPRCATEGDPRCEQQDSETPRSENHGL